jgi:hypothetical protein
VPAELLLLSASAWSKADRYYFASLARLQRLTAAAKAPHKDLVLQEVTAAVRYVQHQMYLLRSQRALLAQLSDTYTQLLQATSTLQSIAAAGQYACSAAGGGSDGCSSSSGLVMPLPPQEWSRKWLLSMQELLCGVTYQLAGFKQLLAAVAPMQQASNLPTYITSSCSSAVTRLQGWTAALQQHKAAVQSAAAALDLGACPVVGHRAVAVLAAAAAAVAEVLLTGLTMLLLWCVGCCLHGTGYCRFCRMLHSRLMRSPANTTNSSSSRLSRWLASKQVLLLLLLLWMSSGVHV